jgi:hypothetical protein
MWALNHSKGLVFLTGFTSVRSERKESLAKKACGESSWF